MSNIINYQSVNSSQIHLHSDNADIYYNGTKKSSVEFFLKEPIKTEKNTIIIDSVFEKNNLILVE